METVGYNINHIGLNVANLTASLHFYVDLIGMRHIFTYHATPYFKIAYIGHIAGGYNGTGYQTPLELNRQKNNMKGLIEFVYIAPDATDPPPKSPLASTRKSNTFSHVGLVVPDIEATQKRLQEANVTILKTTGADPSSTGALPNAYGLGLLPPGSDRIAQTIIQGLAAAGGVSFSKHKPSTLLQAFFDSALTLLL